MFKWRVPPSVYTDLSAMHFSSKFQTTAPPGWETWRYYKIFPRAYAVTLTALTHYLKCTSSLRLFLLSQVCAVFPGRMSRARFDWARSHETVDERRDRDG